MREYFDHRWERFDSDLESKLPGRAADLSFKLNLNEFSNFAAGNALISACHPKVLMFDSDAEPKVHHFWRA